jgi:hypothetical protein
MFIRNEHYSLSMDGGLLYLRMFGAVKVADRCRRQIPSTGICGGSLPIETSLVHFAPRAGL